MTPPRPNWKDRTLMHGDNLDFLKLMDSRTVDLIATDPPFNKGRDFHATPDSLAENASFQDRWSWEKDVHEKWVKEITEEFPNVMNVINGSRNSYGDDMGAFLCFMGVRLLEMKRVLKDTGSIFLHCDPTASHYLKELMDSIFGKENFMNEIIWHYYNIANVARRHFGRKHDIILTYKKSKNSIFNWDEMREPYSPNSNWVKNSKSYKDERYKPNKAGKLMHDVWRIPAINNMANERTKYPTQKPLALYERIIKASSNKDDIVLDPFCGCATTCVAAEKLGRKWVGIDIWKKAHNMVIKRLKKECILDDGKKRTDVLFTKGDITYIKIENGKVVKGELERKDGGREAVPLLPSVMKEFDDTTKDPYTNKQKKDLLVEKFGLCCQGCGIEIPIWFLQLDHMLPGGSDLIRNRILLCQPCNLQKSNTLALEGLRQKVKKLGRIQKKENLVEYSELIKTLERL